MNRLLPCIFIIMADSVSVGTATRFATLLQKSFLLRHLLYSKNRFTSPGAQYFEDKIAAHQECKNARFTINKNMLRVLLEKNVILGSMFMHKVSTTSKYVHAYDGSIQMISWVTPVTLIPCFNSDSGLGTGTCLIFVIHCRVTCTSVTSFVPFPCRPDKLLGA